LAVIDFLKSGLFFLAEFGGNLDYGLFLDFSLLDWSLDCLLLGGFFFHSKDIKSVRFTHSKPKLANERLSTQN
jgi:hypothetical protein